jgi:hypothetical protein
MGFHHALGTKLLSPLCKIIIGYTYEETLRKTAKKSL